MAKDGTNRGGRRVRASDKTTPLANKITAGKAASIDKLNPHARNASIHNKEKGEADASPSEQT